MADQGPTTEQAKQIQTLTAQVDAAWQSTVRARTSLNTLMNAGVATCQDVKTYNLLAMGTYYFQQTISATIRGMGGQSPEIPVPVYITYKGVPGDQAANIDCSKAQMQGWIPTGLGDYFVNPAHVEWRTGPRQADLDAIRQTLAKVQFGQGQAQTQQLGDVIGIVAIILVGIVISVTGYIALKIVEALSGLPQQVEYTKQMQITAQQHQVTLDARAKCLADCTATGKDTSACAKACVQTNPDFNPPGGPGSGLGILGWVLGVGLVVGFGYLIYRWWSGERLLTGGVDDELEGPDDAIDVDFLERVA